MRFSQVHATPYPWPFDGRWSTANTTLLVIDMQQFLMRALARPDVEAAAARLLVGARAANLPVIFTQRLPAPPGVMRSRAEATHGLADALPPDDGAALAILPALEPQEIIARHGWSAFTGTDLAARLQRRGVRNLILFGATTDGALHATMREANDRGHECLLVEDASCAQQPEHHEAILRITRFGHGLFGTTAPTHAIITAMEDSVA